MTRASSDLLGSWPITFLNVRRPTSGSVIPASVYLPMSAGIPYRSSKAIRQDAAPAPPLEIRVPSMSNRTAMRSVDAVGAAVFSTPATSTTRPSLNVAPEVSLATQPEALVERQVG